MVPLAGMTGTAATEVSEFDGIYKLPVAVGEWAALAAGFAAGWLANVLLCLACRLACWLRCWQACWLERCLAGHRLGWLAGLVATRGKGRCAPCLPHPHD